jgi:hypothetical protein
MEGHVVELTEEYRRRMLEETNRAYAALRADPLAWAEECAERAIWDITLQDGLEPAHAASTSDDAVVEGV